MYWPPVKYNSALLNNQQMEYRIYLDRRQWTLEAISRDFHSNIYGVGDPSKLFCVTIINGFDGVINNTLHFLGAWEREIWCITCIKDTNPSKRITPVVMGLFLCTTFAIYEVGSRRDETSFPEQSDWLEGVFHSYQKKKRTIMSVVKKE